jgi:ComEC/Rec2-related protein
MPGRQEISPLCGATLFLCAGIYAQHRTGAPPAFLWAGALTLVILRCFLRSLSGAILSAMFFSTGMLLYANATHLPPDHIALLRAAVSRGTCVLQGTVVKTLSLEADRCVCQLELKNIQYYHRKEHRVTRHTCRGRVTAHLRPSLRPAYGDDLIVQGRLTALYTTGSGRRNGNPGATRNGSLHLYASKGFFPVRSHARRRASITRYAEQIKTCIADTLRRYCSPPTYGVLMAMLLGDKSGISPFTRKSMMATGTIHILVVSGFNVGIIASLIIAVLRIMRLPRLTRLALSCPLLCLYCCMTGASIPVVRATLMAIAMMCAHHFKRPALAINALALAAWAILFTEPGSLFDIGFQLSFASVLSILIIYPWGYTAAGIASLRYAMPRTLASGALVSTAAWVGTAGILAYHFRSISPITVPANIVVVPIATALTLNGICLLAAHALFPALAPFVAFTGEALVTLLIRTTELLSRVPGAHLRIP